VPPAIAEAVVEVEPVASGGSDLGQPGLRCIEGFLRRILETRVEVVDRTGRNSYRWQPSRPMAVISTSARKNAQVGRYERPTPDRRLHDPTRDLQLVII
jgi:hypothetical protein